MSREAYLCVSPYEGAYPSEHYVDFEAEEHMLAGAADATPLLWLAMFRPEDLRDVLAVRSAAGDPGRSLITVPVTSRRRALTNLNAAVPMLDRLLQGSSVSEHAELLRQAMRWLPGAVVTIEWWAGDQPHAAPARLDRALTVFDLGPDAGNSGLDALRQATGLRLQEPLVPARLLLDQALPTTEQRADLVRVLGRSHMRMVPWETPF